MADKRVRVGIIGVGGIALGKHLPSIAKIQGVEIVAFCDVVEENAVKGRDQYGAQGAKVFTDYRELLAQPGIDAVYVLTANFLHAEVTVAALQAGKHVMCEKPMAMTTAEAQAMVDAAERTGQILTIGYQNRFRPDSLYLKQLCERGELGEIYFAKALAIRRRAVPTWGNFLSKRMQGGGPLIDIGTHALDLTLWLMDNYRPKTVMGTAYHKLGQRNHAANSWGPWDPEKFEVEDSAFGFITFENGATVILESSWALNSLHVGEARTVLCGTEGGADMEDGLRINGERHGRLFTEIPDLNIGGTALDGAVSQNAGDVEAAHFIACIREGRQPIVTPKQALVVTQILEAIYESSRTGQAVQLGK
ncbi:Gfo/Idh/MocA family protein [Alicyclobacillus ferrooxydans]|uniref:Oxidoreductase n=1 Tax=Alicyclobacillus ferrooxydans TaxID=471514 RepID=A0A0P9CGS1_9BACL|nr:Gfo/Idh/MocA family oxidoreductase [Alicyclobacillus ferrooxydans]KPV44929.1 oxidoreductase [Alicyclobacillus ferrooxydans]